MSRTTSKPAKVVKTVKVAKPVKPKVLSPAQPVIARAVRVGAASLEKVLAGMGRMSEENKARARRVLVDGVAMHQIAREEDISAELVSSVVRRVRARLNTHIDAWAFVEIPLRLPLTLAEELRGLSDGLAKIEDPDAAAAILKDVLKAVVLAKSKVLYA